MKKHEIIATIGIASKDDQTISEMIDAGMTMARLNFSWDSHDVMSERIAQIRRLAKEKGVEIPIIQDLSGPRVQTGGSHHFDEGALEALTPKDIEDVIFGIKEGCEYIALSYVGSKETVLELKNLIEEQGGKAIVISKIERQKALNNLKEIIEVSDAIMVARGDLGDAVPYEEVPFIQHQIISACNKAGVPVIVATQMLLSMTENTSPTRAEVSDVAYAIVDGATALMLSEETAKGEYPVQAVSAMRRITSCAEKHLKQ